MKCPSEDATLLNEARALNEEMRAKLIDQDRRMFLAFEIKNQIIRDTRIRSAKLLTALESIEKMQGCVFAECAAADALMAIAREAIAADKADGERLK